MTEIPEIDCTKASLLQRIAELEALVRARDKKITELGHLLHRRAAKPSRFKTFLVSTWDRLPRDFQKTIEPFADFMDRVVK